jgi:hypothetical protein
VEILERLVPKVHGVVASYFEREAASNERARARARQRKKERERAREKARARARGSEREGKRESARALRISLVGLRAATSDQG